MTREKELEVRTGDIAVDEVVIARPGEHIPLDGAVIDGAASVDESSFTGESVPSTKQEGSDVIGGTLNLDGLLKVRVTRVGQESFLNQIVRLMTQISAALRAVPGVHDVKPKVPQKHVVVRYEPKRVNEPELRTAVGQAGFTAVER